MYSYSSLLLRRFAFGLIIPIAFSAGCARVGEIRIQDNLDAGCCKIEIDQKPNQPFDPPRTYKDEVARNTNADRSDDVVQVEWDARSQRGAGASRGQIPLNQVNLSPGMADMLCAPGPRDDDCINVYVVADNSMVGKYPMITARQQSDRALAGVNPPRVGTFAGADIKRQRLKPDGTGCEDLKIFRRNPRGGGVTEIPANRCQVNAVVISPSKLASFETLKHEVGHMLGLRHPWEYTPEKLREIRTSEGRKGSIMRYHGSREIYSGEECDMITRQDCNGYQR